jgi:hypothetical protein
LASLLHYKTPTATELTWWAEYLVPEIDFMNNATNTRCEAAMKVRAFHVFIIISFFLITAGMVGNSLFPRIR